MKTVDVVVPVSNEGREISATLVRAADYFSIHSRYRFDFVIVDDASTDETYDYAQTFARHRKNVTVLRHDRVYGVGRALRTAFNKASADYTLVIDPRVPEAPFVAMQLLEVLDTAGSDIALAAGSRGARKWVQQTRSYVHAFTCMIRAYRTQFVKSVQFASDGGAANVELLLEGIKSGAAIVAMPMAAPEGDSGGHVRSLCRIPPVLTHRMWACRAQFPVPYSSRFAQG